MHNLIALPVTEGVSFKIPDNWVKEVGDPGEFAFISADGTVFLTVTFVRFEQTESFPMHQIMEEATAATAEIASFASPIIQTDNYVARQLEMAGQNMLIAMTEGVLANHRIVANLFFKTEDADVFEKNRDLMEQIINAVEIKA